jgi:predicted small metal-binding protein
MLDGEEFFFDIANTKPARFSQEIIRQHIRNNHGRSSLLHPTVTNIKEKIVSRL